MPSFTMELWRVLDMKPADKTDAEWVGLDTYPVFDPAYREGLNKKILDHFMYQEIGQETVDQFRFAMRRKMNEIMPGYNQLYRTTLVEFDPLSTIDIRTIATGESEQESEGTAESTAVSDVDSTAKNVASIFPQVRLSGTADYATNGSDGISETKTEGTTEEVQSAKNTATNASDSRTTGYQGSPAQQLMQVRAAILNVDMLIIAELDSDMFMLAWGNTDEYSATRRDFFPGRYL